jgi:cytochrome c
MYKSISYKNISVISLIGLLLIGSAGMSATTPGLGRTLQQSELTPLDTAILPNGQGLPRGSGSAVQGKPLYALHCVSCHGVAGRDGLHDRLAGGVGSISGSQPVKTLGSYWPYATTVFDYVRRAMPYHFPGSLSDDQVYAITAYLLFLNDIVDESMVVTESSLPQVKMPNRKNFFWQSFDSDVGP